MIPELVIDPEIEKVIPLPARKLPDDDPTIKVKGMELERGIDRLTLWRDNLRESIRSNPADVRVLVWRGKNIIVDGIERYRICRDLGISLHIDYLDFDDRAGAVQERWKRNVTTVKSVDQFPICAAVVKYYDKYLRAERTATAISHKGGRGKHVAPDEQVNQLKERAALAIVSSATMNRAEFVIRYLQRQRAEIDLPEYRLREIHRKLGNGTMTIGEAFKNIKGDADRASRKGKTKEAGSAAARAADAKVSAREWRAGDNVVYCADAFDVLPQLAPASIDRFVFSPPYYLADKESQDFIDYGYKYRPFESWFHYQIWTVKYFIPMWRALKPGGYIVVNVDNTRDPKSRQFYYHTDFLRFVAARVNLFSTWLERLGPDVENFEGGKEFDSYVGTSSVCETDANDKYDQATLAYDRGEFAWAKGQVVAGRHARGSKAAGSRRPNHEYVLFFRKGAATPVVSTMSTEELNLYTKSAWEPTPADRMRQQDNELWGSYWRVAPRPKKNHPATYPPELAYRMITAWGSHDDVICDPFCGVGTGLYVAARTGRRYIGVEQRPTWAKEAAGAGAAGLAEFEENEKQLAAERVAATAGLT